MLLAWDFVLLKNHRKRINLIPPTLVGPWRKISGFFDDISPKYLCVGACEYQDISMIYRQNICVSVHVVRYMTVDPHFSRASPLDRRD